jgi:hypothetical protein
LTTPNPVPLLSALREGLRDADCSGTQFRG